MTKKGKMRNWIIENRIYIGSFMIPFLAMTVMCIVFQVEPFGNQSLAIIDGLHQYMPFFAEYHEKLRNLDSFFYSWNGGLGYNFLSLWSYYLSSPLNLLMLFFPKTMLNAAFSWILVLKIGLLGFTTAAFLIHRSNKYNEKVLIFSTAFAFCNYIVGYSWNIMWMDSIVMLPLVLIGFDKLMENNDGRMYSLCLAFAMIGNFYIAFMICIFLVLWYLCYHHETVKAFFVKGILFGFYSVLSALLAGIGLLPAYLGIMNTASAELMTLPEHGWLTNIFNMLKTHLVGTAPITNDNFDGNANLYICILTVVLVFLYFMIKEISFTDKVKRIGLISVFIISFNEKILNFIWHGFHDQYGIPNRFAFLYLFVLMFTAFEACIYLEGVCWQKIGGAVLFTFLFFTVIACEADGEFDKISFFITSVMIMLYGFLLYQLIAGKMDYKKAMGMLFLFSLIEVIGMAAYGFSENGQIDIDKFYSDTEAIEQVKKDIPEDELVRTSLLKSKMLDEEIWHGLKCVSIFGSTANGGAVTMMDHWGFFTGANEYLYKGATPLTNVLFNVKYNIRRNDDKNLHDFTIKKSYENMDLLENPYETAIGYGVVGYLEEWNYTSVYPFDVQNSFVSEAYHRGEIFHNIEIPDPVTCECSAERTNRGEYRFENTSSQANNLVFTIPVMGGEDLYIHYDGSRVENAIVKVGEEVRVSQKINSEIYHVGLIEPGQTVSVSFQLKDDGNNSGVIRLSAADFNQWQFDAIYAEMIEEKVVTKSYTSDSLEGYIDKKEEGLVIFSIPYDEGWSLFVDGKESEKVKVADGLLGVKMDAGYHDITLKYISPGFKEGAMLSGFGVLLMIGISICFYFRKKKLEQM